MEAVDITYRFWIGAGKWIMIMVVAIYPNIEDLVQVNGSRVAMESSP